MDLLWFLCGSSCGFWSRVVFGSGLRVRSCSCGFCGSVVLSRCRCRRLRVRSCSCGFLSRVIVSILEIVDKDINVPGYHGEGTCGFCGSVVLPSMPMPTCGFCGSVVLPSMPKPTIARSIVLILTAKKICPSPHFVLCSVSSPLEATFTNGENDHG